ncbi:MAG TPA: hypothetical protein VFA50_21195 [Stellaceae bacterium]|nr:hypothetical protein [Stellaceae bacterium]
MDLFIDPDVKSIAEYMQSSLSATRLVPVAMALAKLAPILWGRYSVDEVDVLALIHDQLSASGSAISQPAASGSVQPHSGAGDGSVVVAGAE